MIHVSGKRFEIAHCGALLNPRKRFRRLRGSEHQNVCPGCLSIITMASMGALEVWLGVEWTPEQRAKEMARLEEKNKPRGVDRLQLKHYGTVLDKQIRKQFREKYLTGWDAL